MKSKVLALLIPALLAAGAAHAAEVYNKDGNKLDLYGKVDGLHYFSDNSAKDGDQSYARLGFKGETQINDQLTGYGQWEYNIQANNTESSKNQSWTRLAFAGLKFADYGSFDYGRNYGVMYDIEGWTDMLPEFGGDSYTNADNFMTGRANGVATYRNTDFFGLVNGLNFAVQYQGNNEGASNGQEGTNNGRDVRHENGDGWGLSTTYDLGMGFSAGAAYTSSDRTNDQVNHTAAGGADNPAGVDDKDLVKYADIGATYYFNKNMSTYVDYKINLLDEDDSFYAANGISTDDIVALGLVYQF
ncbi:TPA: porin [Escherichia coli]|nr:porin [Escherichia coli]